MEPGPLIKRNRVLLGTQVKAVELRRSVSDHVP